MIDGTAELKLGLMEYCFEGEKEDYNQCYERSGLGRSTMIVKWLRENDF